MTAPGRRTDNLRIGQTLANLTSYVNASNLQVPLDMTNVLFVDGTAGSDVDGQPGRPDLPFATIQRAVNCAFSGATIQIGAGTYAENVVIPATLSSLTIVGAGMYSTVIQPAAAGIALAYTGTATGTVMTRLVVKDICLIGVTDAINVQSALAPTGFQGGLILDHVLMQSTGAAIAARFIVLNNVEMYDCSIPVADGLDIVECSTCTMERCITGVININYTVALAWKPSLGVGRKNLRSCRFNGLNIGAGCIEDVYCDKGCVSTGDVVVDVNDSVLGNGVFEFHGTVVTSMTLTHTLGAARTAFNCDGCKVQDLAGTVSIVSAAAGAGFIATARFREAVLGTAAAGGITTGNNSALDLLGAQFNHGAAVLVTTVNGGATGVANRSVHRQATAMAGAGLQTITFGVPFIDANYSVSVETTAPGRDPLVTNKLPTAFDLTHAVGADANANVVVVHQ